jgi:hypothetical protein
MRKSRVLVKELEQEFIIRHMAIIMALILAFRTIHTILMVLAMDIIFRVCVLENITLDSTIMDIIILHIMGVLLDIREQEAAFVLLVEEEDVDVNIFSLLQHFFT